MMKKVWLMLAMMVCIFASCSGGGEEPVTPTQKPEVVKSEITIDTGIISNGLSFSAAGGEQSISFTTNESWTLSVASTTSGSAWCTASATSGSKGSASVKFTVTENTSYDNRSVSVTIKSGTATKTFTISQKGVDALLVTTDKYEVSQEGGTISIEVKANIDYKMEISEKAKDWIKESSTRALTAYKHTLSISANEEVEKREGEIHFKSGDKVETVKVYQAGGAILVLSQNEYNVSDKGDTISVDIKSNIEFGVQMPDVDWIVDEASSRGFSSHTLKYVIKANEGYDSRSANIVFFDKNSELKDTLKVVQAQKDAIILSQKEFIIEQEGGTIEVKINTNIDFEVTMPNINWIRRVESRGLVEHCLYFEIDENENEIERNAQIVFNCPKSHLSDTLKIEQKKFVKGLRLPIGLEFLEKVNNYRSKIKNQTGKMPTKVKFIANSNVSSESILIQDTNGMVAYLKAKGEWVEIHTLADEFIAHEDCSRMFYYMGLTSIDFGKGFNTSNVTDMSQMFVHNQSLDSLNIDMFDTSNVTNMDLMFLFCDNLKKINVNHFDVSKVTSMRAMFQNCVSLETLDVSNFNTENVTNMRGMFSNCSNLSFLDVTHFKTSNVEDMEAMFQSCSSLKELDLSNFDTSSVTDMSAMFEGGVFTGLDVSTFNTENVENMTCMFDKCENLKSLDLSCFNTENAIKMWGMFRGCHSLEVLNLSNFNTEKVTQMQSIFEDLNRIKELNLGNNFIINSGETYLVHDFASISKECKIICTPETKDKLSYHTYGLYTVPHFNNDVKINWINSKTNESM